MRSRISSHIPSGGVIAGATRVLKIKPQSVSERVKASPILQRAIQIGRSQLVDVADDNVTRAIHEREMITTRWFLDRRGRDRGYGVKVDHEDVTPPDPAEESRRAAVVSALVTMIEDRARAGLPPLLGTMLDITPKKEP